MVRDPTVELALAVAASSAFPPILSPLALEVDPASFDPAEARGPLHVPPYTTDVVLSDGGVYDNLGLETAWKRYTTILVSDGGGQMGPEPKPQARLGSPRAPHQRRDRQPGAQPAQAAGRRRLPARRPEGAYWGIRSHIGDYGPPARQPAVSQTTRRFCSRRPRRGWRRWTARCRSG